MSQQIVPAHELFVVDDDATMREALSAVFTLAGYRVTVFAGGASFIAAARDHAPAAVMLNLHLPDTSGLLVGGAGGNLRQHLALARREQFLAGKAASCSAAAAATASPRT